MFLSRIQLNPARRDARHLLASAQRIHAAVLLAFPDPPAGAVDGPRVLWRLDREGPRAWLYVSGPSRPDFTHLVEQAGWPASEETWLTRDYQPLLDKLDVGQRWGFRLVANPVHKVKIADNETDTQRRAMLGVGMRESWLYRKAELHGFQVATALSESGENLGPALTLTAADVAEFSRRDPEAGGRKAVTIARTQYDGVLEVTDPESLRLALVRGIGPAKAYGCGLMTLVAG
jgi:CRISPR system Cascade subunit CasE